MKIYESLNELFENTFNNKEQMEKIKERLGLKNE